MLRLTLTPGDYFTINGNIVVQLHRLEGERSLIAVEAPKEMRIVRGAVLEREGGQRPLCLTDRPAPDGANGSSGTRAGRTPPATCAASSGKSRPRKTGGRLRPFASSWPVSPGRTRRTARRPPPYREVPLFGFIRFRTG